MTCQAIRATLIGYCFNDLEPAEREAVEGHLPGCPGCVGELIALKRAIDLSEEAPRPSKAARERLREAVVAALRPPPRPRRLWERPLALALAAAAVLLAMNATRRITSGPGEAPVTWPSRAEPPI